MAMVIKVRFKRASKLYDFDPNGLELHNGTPVITETARGIELGECAYGIMEIPDDRVVSPLKPILRIATEADLAQQRNNEESEKQAFDIALDRIAEHNLEMKLVDVEYAFDRSKIIFYFTANGRVDFRLLVKNLASIFKTRIELRQIGVRDEAKMLGGIGPCGRPICCRSFLGDFTPVSIKMAKEQNLSLNPTKISGLCDRLMCCLKYEQDHYEATRKRMPRVGRDIVTPDGVGTISAINVLSETVRVRIAVGDSFELREYPIDDCQRVNQEPTQARRQPEESEPSVAEREAPQSEPQERVEPAAQAEAPAEPAQAAQPRPARERNRQERAPRPPREEREGRQENAERPERPARPQREGGKQERPPRPARESRPERPPREERVGKPTAQERPQRPPKGEAPGPRRQMPRPRDMKPKEGPEMTLIEESAPLIDLIEETAKISIEETVQIREETTLEDLL